MDSAILNQNFNLNLFATKNAALYQNAVPYPHIVIDNLFNPIILDRLLKTFPAPSEAWGIRHNDGNQVKLSTSDESQIPKNFQEFLYQLNSSTFLRFLEKLTGIDYLLPDPHFNGGGLHQILRGGKLGIHADFNKLSGWNLDRRLNLLVYLNKEWLEDYGGAFEMWDQNMTRCVKKVFPLFNRIVIFSTSSFSYHGHPHPLQCPEGWSRKSMALYYYTNGYANGQSMKKHSTVFKLVPTRDKMGQIFNLLVPPLLVNLYENFKSKKNLKKPTTLDHR